MYVEPCEIVRQSGKSVKALSAGQIEKKKNLKTFSNWMDKKKVQVGDK